MTTNGKKCECIDPESTTLAAMLDEAQLSWEVYGFYRSPHEAYGVLAEEMLELLEAIHANDEGLAREEALQISAVAFRFAAQGSRRNYGDGRKCQESAT